MIYANDLWAQLPTKDLYDTQIMMAAVSAAKDMYDKGQQQIEKFYEKYGNFQSPFKKDMERYNDLMDLMNDQINSLYEAGIDPVRSTEGRQMVLRMIGSYPIGEFNQMKSNAAIGEQYLQSMLKLMSSGNYSEDLERYDLARQGLPNFDDFSTAEYGTWNRISPIQQVNWFDIISPSVKNMSPSKLTKDEVESITGEGSYDPHRLYKGRSELMLNSVLGEVIPGLEGTFAYDYYKDLARRKLIANGNTNPTDLEVYDLFLQDSLTTVHSLVGITDEDVDPLYLNSLLFRLNAYLNSLKNSKPLSSGQKTDKTEYDYISSVYDNTVARTLNMTPADVTNSMYSAYSDGGNQGFYKLQQNYVNSIINRMTKAFNNEFSGTLKTINGSTELTEFSNIMRNIQIKSLDDPQAAALYMNIDRDKWYDEIPEDVRRNLYSSKEIVLSSYGMNIDNINLNILQTPENSPYRYVNGRMNNSESNYKIQPNGNTAAVVMKDGKIHIFTQVRVHEQYQTTNPDDETKKITKKRPVGYGWYDMGISSSAGTILPDSLDFTRTYTASEGVNRGVAKVGQSAVSGGLTPLGL